MEVVGLVFATVATVHLIIELGIKISQRVAELENADKLVAYLSDFGVESSRQTLKLQLELGQSVCNDPFVDDGVKEVLDKTFVEFQKTLNTASEQVESTLASSAKKRHYFVYKRNRESLASTVKRLKELAQDFKDTIGLVRTARTTPPATFLSRNIFQVFEKPMIDITDGVSLRQGQLTSKLGRNFPRTGYFVLERRPYIDDADDEELEDNIKDLTKLLASSDHSEGILDVVGYAKDSKAKCYNLVFAMPEQVEFEATLRDMLCSAPQTPPLEVRISICLQLADSVLHVHHLGLVHKNISPMSIAMMKHTSGSSANHVNQGQLVFLLDWHYVRRASDATNRAGETQWWRGVYCHPKRQMQVAQEEYNMGHDIYSLGVCMLEVLIWKSLVESGNQGPHISPMFKEQANHLKIPERNRVELGMRGIKTESELYMANPFGVQQVLEELARTSLPPVAGSRLSQLVVSCLSALEGGFPNVSFDQKDDVETAMNFIVLVKMALAQTLI